MTRTGKEPGLKFQTPKNGRVQYNDDLHKYTIDGKPVPSVSQIVYNNVDDYLFASKAAMNAAAQFGTVVHELAHWHNTGKKVRLGPAVSDHGKPLIVEQDHLDHLDQFKTILRANKFTVVGSEVLLYSLQRKYAGRTDGLILDENGLLWIFDIKTGKLDPRAALQMGGYALAAEEIFGKTIAGGLIFQLNGTGSVPIPKRYTDRNDRLVFLAKLTSLQWDIANMGARR